MVDTQQTAARAHLVHLMTKKTHAFFDNVLVKSREKIVWCSGFGSQRDWRFGIINKIHTAVQKFT